MGLFVGFAGQAGASDTFFPFSQPGTSSSSGYTGNTCAIDLSSIPDGTTGIRSVTGCGVTVTFSVPMAKSSVPANPCCWGSPPDTESATPNVLYTPAAAVTLVYRTGSPGGAGRRTVGVEAEDNEVGTWTLTATFSGALGVVDGSITRNVTSSKDTSVPNDALLFAARTKNVSKVRSLTISSNEPDGLGLFIAQIRV